MTRVKDALRVEHLSHAFGTTAVLHDVSFSLAQGEVLALLGPSGSGKSTLLHLVGGLDTPSRGRVLWGDTDLSSLSAEERARRRNLELGLIFQHHYLLEDLSALENAALPALIAHRPDQDRAERLLRSVGLGARLGNFPAQLSGGERQRVALARALMLRPRLLLADEPTGSLDQANSRAVMDLLLGLALEEGAGVLLVTHDEALALRAHRVLRLVDGRLLVD
ncbi:lipoprotein-releasing system ATP-binding protein [Deinobacterium chartae]|uniref:Lipoprotein-releasing system ATP-binding protein n=1 Tax=Deinobacterium chartae TaxID=521158 RepID=A0A841HVV0_9DEIO|nr:ABC transporter ATP-binding protein [Deinobacterium chartae]MBB6097641.1 lipoprotein-releasing system ATP-binding protein [Deinobacterium chartae]